jgi:uncharacterized protein YggU (UPF0235/DUF167 family)
VAQLAVRVTPRGRTEALRALDDGTLSVVVTRPAVGGEATEATRRLLAKALDVPQSTVQLTSGARSRLKRFEISSLDDGELGRRLRRLPAAR